MKSFVFPSLPSFRVRLSHETEETLSNFGHSFQNEHYLLSFCVKNDGESGFLVRNRLFIPHPGDALLISSFDYQHFIHKGGEFREARLYLPPEIMETLCPCCVSNMCERKHLLRFDAMQKYTFLSEDINADMPLLHLLLLLSELEERAAIRSLLYDSSPLPLVLQKALYHLLHHYNEKASGTSLASVLGVSTKTVDEQFRTYLGITVGHLSERLRYVKAAELAACGIPRQRIADAVGVADGRGLSALLRKYAPANSAPLKK